MLAVKGRKDNDKDIDPLVGIDVRSLLELVLLIAGTMWSLYRSDSPGFASLPMFPYHSDYDLILSIDSHVSECLTARCPHLPDTIATHPFGYRVHA